MTRPAGVHRGCSPWAMTFSTYGAQCGGCGARWTIGRGGYVLVVEPRRAA